MNHRFVAEYANYLTRFLRSATGLNPARRDAMLREVERVLNAYKRDYITVVEAMRLLSDVPHIR